MAILVNQMLSARQDCQTVAISLLLGQLLPHEVKLRP
jgi:hypothetical protein